MNDMLRQLVDAPLADPLKINLPLGRQPAPRQARPAYTPAPGDLTPREVKERRAKAVSDKVRSVLDYYAGTQVPVERIAQHTGLTVEQARRAMRDRGRAVG